MFVLKKQGGDFFNVKLSFEKLPTSPNYLMRSLKQSFGNEPSL